jgi:hypothetical protein
LVAEEDVVVVERVVHVRAGFEPFVDIEFEVEPDIFEAAGTSAERRPADPAVDCEAVADGTDREIDREDLGEGIGSKIGEDEGLVNVERPAGLKDAADVDFGASALRSASELHVPELRSPA